MMSTLISRQGDARRSMGREVGWLAFRTALGWMGIAWSEDAKGRFLVCRTSMGHVKREPLEPAFRGMARIAVAPDEDAARLVERLTSYAEVGGDTFDDVALIDELRTPFQRAVRRHCRRIPLGSTCSYGDLARRAGSPRAARAVGNLMAANPMPLLVPCHRVVGAAGVGGFSAPRGLDLKRQLLHLEGVDI